MIKSWKHKGLKKFYTTGSEVGIESDHAEKLQERLDLLNIATDIQDMNVRAYRLHPLQGKNRAGVWSIEVNGNWRITFKFIDGDAYILNYEDYH